MVAWIENLALNDLLAARPLKQQHAWELSLHCCCDRHTDALSMHITDWFNGALLPAKTLHQLCCAFPNGLNEQKQKIRKAFFAAGAGNAACMKAFVALLL